MKRKLISQGKGDSVTLYIPKKWIDNRGLKAGDEVDIDEMDHNLIISTEVQKIQNLSTEIKLKNLTESMIRTAITYPYRLGYDKVTVFYYTKNQLEILKNVVKTRLLGFEIVSIDEKGVIIENITEPSGEKFEVLMQKIIYNTGQFFECIESILQKQKPFYDYNDIQHQIQLYDNFCRRVITKRKAIEKNATLYWSFLTVFIHATRNLYHFAKYIEKYKGTISKPTIKFFEEAKEIYSLVKKAYLSQDLAPIELAHEKEKILSHKTTHKLIKGNEASLIHYISKISRGFYLSSSPLVGLFMEHS